MKNQLGPPSGRIEELLAESLRKQNQHSELLTKLVESDERQNLLLEKLVDG
ncbi:MAG: hypothetical protein ACFB15_03450 [Cyclobacteriaceae bacterium]